MKKTITISAEIEDIEYLKEGGVSPSGLFAAAVRQLKAKEMFIDPNTPYDTDFLLGEIARLRSAIATMQGAINSLQPQGEENVQLA